MKLRSLLSLLLCTLLLCSCTALDLPSPSSTESPAPSSTIPHSTAASVPSSPSSSAPSTETPAPSSTVPHSTAASPKPSVSAPTSQPFPSAPPTSAFPEGKEEAFVLPAYEGKPYTVIGDNTPSFSSLTTTAYESYPSLDALGRCQTVHACLGRELMPTEDRESIGMVKPSGWQTAKYDFVDGKYLYNRCHLIGFQLAGENANKNNLITGTRSMNVKGMLPFENMVADYIKETENHVMFRVTPVFVDNELVARGVRMEAYSVEDRGEGICFDVFVFNVEPGVIIDYGDGSNRAADAPPATAPKPTQATDGNAGDYILNTNTKKIHYPHCSSVKKMSEKNRSEFHGEPDSLLKQGYSYCGICFR